MAGSFAELAGRTATARGGRIVKLLGDGALLRFDDATAAVDASLDLLAAMPAGGLPPGHAGVADGPIVVRDGDVFGRTVNLASRIADVAGAATLLAPADLGERLSGGGFAVRSFGARTLQGVAKPVDLVEVRRA